MDRRILPAAVGLSATVTRVFPIVSPHFRGPSALSTAPIVGRTTADRYTLPVVANDTCTRVAVGSKQPPYGDDL